MKRVVPLLTKLKPNLTVYSTKDQMMPTFRLESDVKERIANKISLLLTTFLSGCQLDVIIVINYVYSVN